MSRGTAVYHTSSRKNGSSPTMEMGYPDGSEVRLGGEAPIIQPSDDLPGFHSFAWDKVPCGAKPSPPHALPRPEVSQPSSMIPQVSLRRQGLETGPCR